MLRITGGRVYDPANNVHGEVRDVCVSGGKVVGICSLPVANLRSGPHTRVGGAP